MDYVCDSIGLSKKKSALRHTDAKIPRIVDEMLLSRQAMCLKSVAKTRKTFNHVGIIPVDSHATTQQ
jgi:hypothetical protein